MTLSLLTPLLFFVSVAAGLLGSLTGLGGGVVIIPVLVLGFGVDLRYAIGASLIAVIATSSGAAAAYVRDGFTNVRIAMILEIATTAGALAGAWIAGYLPLAAISIIFGLVLLQTAYNAARPPVARPFDAEPDALGTRLGLNGDYPATEGPAAYFPRRIPQGFAVMFGAGVLSALVGVGSGVIKVIAMDRLMRLPFKVSTATSNFMIGVTAAASAGVYLHRGQVAPALAGPIALGALAGAMLGAKLLPRVRTRTLRIIFGSLVALAGIQMIVKGATGTL